jgi:quinol-cytochrome oxidoreductase complex cytochrome b subunit
MSSDGFLDRFCFYLERLLFWSWVFLRDLFLFFCFLFFFWVGVFCAWFFVFHEESFLLSNVVKTSDKIIPEWFFLFFFGFIKSVPDKFLGLCLLFCFFVSFVLGFGSYFEFYGRSFFVFCLNFSLFFCLFLVISLLAVIVILVYPCYLELQFFVCFFFGFNNLRF